MKKDLIVLLFHTQENAKLLNIGDNALLSYSHHDHKYILTDNDGKIYGYQIRGLEIPEPSDVESLLGFVSDKNHSDLTIWDDELSNYLIDNYVEVAAINKDYIIVQPSAESQFLLSKEERVEKVQDIDPFYDLFDLLGYDCCEERCEAPSGVRVPMEDPTGEIKEEKEETNMFSGLGSSFGKINSDQFKLSINGLAVRGKEGKYLTFNPETRELVEVTTGFFDDMKDLLFLMPTTELEVGDIILHQNKPYYITVSKDNVVKGIDFEDAIESTLVPKTNVFGIKYYTKVFNCLGTNNILGGDLAGNPMMAYALMGGKDFDLSKIMLFQAMSGQGNGIADFSENPVMLMALMSNENGGGDLGNFAKMQILSQLSGNKKKEVKKATKEN